MKIKAWYHEDQYSGYGFMQCGVFSIVCNGGRPEIPINQGIKVYTIEFEVPDIPGLQAEPIKASVKQD